MPQILLARIDIDQWYHWFLVTDTIKQFMRRKQWATIEHILCYLGILRNGNEEPWLSFWLQIQSSEAVEHVFFLRFLLLFFMYSWFYNVRLWQPMEPYGQKLKNLACFSGQESVSGATIFRYRWNNGTVASLQHTVVLIWKQGNEMFIIAGEGLAATAITANLASSLFEKLLLRTHHQIDRSTFYWLSFLPLQVTGISPTVKLIKKLGFE